MDHVLGLEHFLWSTFRKVYWTWRTRCFATTFAGSQSIGLLLLRSPKISRLWVTYEHNGGNHSVDHSSSGRHQWHPVSSSTSENIFNVFVDCAKKSVAVTTNNTCDNLLSCCKFTWNKSFIITLFFVPAWHHNLNMYIRDFIY